MMASQADQVSPMGRQATVAAEPTDSVSFERLLHGRFSCRAYLPDRVPHATIEAILELAQFTASWCNSQPWEVLITEGEGTERFRDALYNHALTTPDASNDHPFPERYVGQFKDRQRECGWQLYRSLGIEHGDRAASGQQAMENFRLFGAPHAAIITSERDLGVYGVLDCGGYVQNFLLAARSLGIASIAQAALAMHGKFVRAYFGIPENRTIICGISFGYADPGHPANAFRTGRASPASVTKWFED